jgi:hypothetical protein
MRKKHLTERNARAVDALQTRVLGLCRASTNEGVLTPYLVTDPQCSNCSSLPVRLDYPFTHRCTHAFSRHFRKIAVWLPDFYGRLGDTHNQCHYQRLPLSGNRNKLTIALALVRSLAPVMMNKPVVE